MTDERSVNRREFFRSGLRYLTFGALAAIGGVLATRPKSASQTCSSNGVCRACAALNACPLPQALSTRQETHS